MTNTLNLVDLCGYLGNDPEEITTEKSNFITFSLGTANGKSTDWHKVIIFDGHARKQYNNFKPKKGDNVRICGTISYSNREIKDAQGNVIITVKEASIIVLSVLLLNRKKDK